MAFMSLSAIAIPFNFLRFFFIYRLSICNIFHFLLSAGEILLFLLPAVVIKKKNMSKYSEEILFSFAFLMSQIKNLILSNFF